MGKAYSLDLRNRIANHIASGQSRRSASRHFGVKNQRLPTVMIGSQQAITDDMARHILGERYVRIDRALATDQMAELALDSASDIAKRDLQAAAASSIAETSASVMLKTMLDHHSPDFTFVNASL